ncbi:MAG: DUF4743 domain-containing protein [Actinomycetota bacterium]
MILPIMAYLDHVAACNAHDITRFRPFMVERRHVGWVRHDTARRLAAFPDTFRVGDDAVALHPRLDTPDARSAALDEACAALHREWAYPRLRGERFIVGPGWGQAPLATIDRGHASVFGVRAYGVHVNGFVRGADGALALWVARRAADKPVAPGKLDNMIAGGQPAGLGLLDNLVKEAHEEADVPEALARTARPVGLVSYVMEDEWGLKPDTMFCFDLELPADFTPHPRDGEAEHFVRMPVAEVARLVRDTDQFKFNVNLVILDFLIRRGVLTPDTDPDYAAICQGLRKGW